MTEVAHSCETFFIHVQGFTVAHGQYEWLPWKFRARFSLIQLNERSYFVRTACVPAGRLIYQLGSGKWGISMKSQSCDVCKGFFVCYGSVK
jgi:hypothetical protein